MQRIYWTNIVTETPSEMCSYLYAVIQVCSKFQSTFWDFCLTLSGGWGGGGVLTVFSSVADGYSSFEREKGVGDGWRWWWWWCGVGGVGGGWVSRLSIRVLCPKSPSFSPSDVRHARVAYALAIHSGRLTPHRHKTAWRKVKYLPPGENKALSLC